MDAELPAKLESIVSAPRLQRYRSAARTGQETVTLYCWNIQLAEAVMPALSIFEVALRNAVHNVLTAHTGTEFWFKSILHRQMYDNIADLIDRITRRQGRPPTVGKVLSEITFGFWPRIFAKSYNSLWWSQSEPLLATVLVNHPHVARDTRKELEQRLEYFVTLRNRVVHQEAVFDGVAALNHPVLPIEIIHRQLLETIGWINTDAARLVSCLDRFDAVHGTSGRLGLEATIKAGFAVP